MKISPPVFAPFAAFGMALFAFTFTAFTFTTFAATRDAGDIAGAVK